MMKVDHINTDRDSTWHTNVTVEHPCSSLSRTAIAAEFKPHNGPKESGYFEPLLEAEFVICCETTSVSTERMLHITPDEIWLELRGRFLIQVSGMRQATSLPGFLRRQDFIEGSLLLNLSRNGTFRIAAAFEPAHRGNLRVTIKFLGHSEPTERSHEFH